MRKTSLFFDVLIKLFIHHSLPLQEFNRDESSWTHRSEREAAEAMVQRQRRKRFRLKTLGADKAYDTKDFVAKLRQRKIIPHVAQNTERRGGSAIDGRTTRHVSYQISQRIRKWIEEIYGWMKTVGGFRKTRYRGKRKIHLSAWFVGVAYNLLRISELLPQEVAV